MVQKEVFQEIKHILHPPHPMPRLIRLFIYRLLSPFIVFNTWHFSQKQTRHGFPFLQVPREL